MEDQVKNIINRHIDDAISELVEQYKLEYGDISPRQQLELDGYINGVEKIVVAWVKQNGGN